MFDPPKPRWFGLGPRQSQLASFLVAHPIASVLQHSRHLHCSALLLTWAILLLLCTSYPVHLHLIGTALLVQWFRSVYLY